MLEGRQIPTTPTLARSLGLSRTPRSDIISSFVGELTRDTERLMSPGMRRPSIISGDSSEEPEI